MVRLNRPPPRPADPPQFGLTQPLRIVGSESDEGWQREADARWRDRGFDLALAEQVRLDATGSVEARRQLEERRRSNLTADPELYDALREAIIEREAIEVEIATMVREHDVDALESNLPALRVPSEDRTFARLVWLVRRWWARLVAGST
jgi:hypothetical protein